MKINITTDRGTHVMTIEGGDHDLADEAGRWVFMHTVLDAARAAHVLDKAETPRAARTWSPRHKAV